MRSKALVGLGIVVILVVIAALAAPRFIDVNRYRPQIEAKLQDRLNRNVSLGPMRLSLIPLAFRVDNVRIDEDPKFVTGRPFAQIQTLYVRPRLLPLFHHEVEIKSLQLDRPALELIRNEQGVWNFSSLVEHKQEAEPGSPKPSRWTRPKYMTGRLPSPTVSSTNSAQTTTISMP